MSARRIVMLCVWLLPVTAGCGSGLASVSGTVTLDGQPIAGGPEKYGTVTFYRESGGGAPAVGIIDESGGYELKTGAQHGVEPGTYLVGISVKKITMPTIRDGMPLATQITPLKYASVSESGFREVVKSGSNTINFALLSASK